jgi:hypothetical protein
VFVSRAWTQSTSPSTTSTPSPLELVPFSSITAADVRRCGESDREALRNRAAHAGPVRDDTAVYRIEFHVAGPAT